jgi:general secretion pathway protein C
MIIAGMLTPAPVSWIVRGATFALWALAAGSAAYWGLKLSAGTPPANAPVAAPRQVGPVDPMAMARLLGSTPQTAAAPAPVVALASRLQLVGVAAGARSGGGAAVISVDGKPARPYRVGSVIEEGLVLRSVRGRQAVVASADGRSVLTLEVPQARLDASRAAAPGMPPAFIPPPAGRPPMQAPPPNPAPVPLRAGEAPQAPTEEPR